MKNKEIQSNKIIPILKINNDFSKNFFLGDSSSLLLNNSFTCFNLIFKIISDLNKYTYQKHADMFNFKSDEKIKVYNYNQYKLWNEEFMSDKQDIDLIYKRGELVNRGDEKLLIVILSFLKTYEYRTYTFTNSKNEKVTTSGGLIKDWQLVNNSGKVRITIDQGWADNIVTLNTYNRFYTNALEKIKNSKHIYFLLWLGRMQESLKKKGEFSSPVGLDKFNELFELNYSKRYDLIHNFLIPIKKKLDSLEYGYSFNFSTKDVKEHITIITRYELKPNLANSINSAEIENLSIKLKGNYKLKYFTLHHQLNKENIEELKELMKKHDLDNYYTALKKEIKSQRDENGKLLKMKSLQGNGFILKIKNLLSKDI